MGEEQGDFKLNHKKRMLRQRNLIFVQFNKFHLISYRSSTWVQLTLVSLRCHAPQNSWSVGCQELSFIGPGCAWHHSLAHLGLEPHFSCVHVSSFSSLTGEALSLYHRSFPMSPCYKQLRSLVITHLKSL